MRPDGSVVLRAWQDQVFRKDNKTFIRLTKHSAFEDSPDNLGYKERIEHLKKVEGGSKCFLVMCRAVDTRNKPREIASFNSEDIFVGGELLSHEGDQWIELADRKPWRMIE